MDEKQIENAAIRLLRSHESLRSIRSVPFDIVDESTAYRIQRAVSSQLGTVCGWKLGVDSRGELVHAPLYKELSQRSPANCRRKEYNHFLVECELALVFAKGLPQRSTPYTIDEIVAAVGTIHAAIEVVDSRFAKWPDVGPLWLLADGMSHGSFVLGEGQKLSDPAMLLSASYALSKSRSDETMSDSNSELVASGHEQAHPLADPWAALTWLANTLAELGKPLTAGTVVTTGTFSGVTPLEAGDHAELAFRDIGRCLLAVSSTGKRSK